MELNGLQKEIFLSRYAMPGETTWEECARRVSHHVSQAEPNGKAREWEEEFFKYINSGWLMPGGRILFGSGRRNAGLLNCFVVDVEDSAESIGKMINDIYLISTKGGGVGINFSAIRPKGNSIQNIPFSAPGAVSVMEMVNEIGSHVRSGGGRRTALIAILDVGHPDLLEFLKVKLDLKKLNNFNISVAITNEFIKAVHEGKEWEFKFAGRQYYIYQMDRIDKDSSHETIYVAALNEEDALGRAQNHYKIQYSDKFENIQKVTIKAREIFDSIIKNACRTGDPGFYHIDLSNSLTNVSYFLRMNSTNPCQPEWATVLTPNKISTIKDVKVGDLIWTGNKWSKIVRKESSGIKNIYAYRTTAGTFYGTEEHKIISNGTKTEVDLAESIDTSQGPYGQQSTIIPIDKDPQNIMDGIVLGDGSVHKASNNLVHLYIGTDDKDYFESEISHLILRHRPGIKETVWEIKTNISHDELPKTYLRVIPDRYRFGNVTTLVSFLRGLYSANGSICGNRVTLKSSSFKLIEQVQEMLSALGIKSYYTRNKSSKVEFYNGTYDCKQSYDLNISTDINKFAIMIGFIQQYKQNKLEKFSSYVPTRIKTNYEIIAKEFISKEEVFNLTIEDDSHTYWTGGLLVLNCGELSLDDRSACCLGSINLSEMYDEKKNDVDWKRLSKTIQIGVRFLDDVLTTNRYPITESREASHKSRRIGLGVLGLHYLLIKLGHRYGDEKCLEALERLFATIRNEAYKASVEIAKEKGSFPAFDAEKFLKEEFAKKLPQRIRKAIKQHGIRNALLLTVPPTGTTSMVLGVSSGIEPIFAPVYERTYRDGNTWKTTLVVDPLFKEFTKEGKNTSHIIGAHDVTAEQHLATQATIQQYICSSISKTINIPENFDESKLSTIILEYISDLKGVTLYRTNSRGIEPLKPVKITKKILSSVLKDTESQVNSLDSCRDGTCEI